MNKLKYKLPHRKTPEYKLYPRRYLCDIEYLPYLKLMCKSIKSHSLIVVLSPNHEGSTDNKKRKKADENPLWFREFSSRYNKNRGKYYGKKRLNRKKINHHTKINRKNVINTLEKLIENKYSHSKYFEDYIEIAKQLKQEEKLSEELYAQGYSLEDIQEQCQLYFDIIN